MSDLTTKFDDISMQTFDKFKGVKAIFFDFDFTLYCNLSWDGFDEWFVDTCYKLFPELTKAEYFKMLKDNNFILDRAVESMAKLLFIKNKDMKGFLKIVDSIKYETNFEQAKVFSNTLLKQLAQTKKLYIVSNSSNENIKFVASKIGLDLSSFTKIFSNRFYKKDLSKIPIYKKARKDAGVQFSEILSVGDSIEHDITPSKKMGMQTLLIQS